VFAKKGPASEAECPATTIPNLFKVAAEKYADKPALRVERVGGVKNGATPGAADFAAKKFKRPTDAPPAAMRDDASAWVTWTYREYYDQSEMLAKAFIDKGVAQFDAVAIFGFNSPEWLMASQATFMTGAKTAGIYPTDTPEQIAYKCKHSGAKVIVLEDKHCLDKYSQVADEVTGVKTIVIWNTTDLDVTSLPGGQDVIPWDDMIELGKAAAPAELAEREKNMRPGHCCCLIYTSGTTGMPKAVMVSHDNINFEATTVMGLIKDKVGNGLDASGNPSNEERLISYLPLSHVAGMMVDIVCPVTLTADARNNSYTTVHFARPYDLKLGTLKNSLQAIQPTFFIGVPRVWEKIQETMKAIGATITGVKAKISAGAKAKGLAHSRNLEMGGSGAYPCCYGLAEKVIFSKVKQNLGLDCCKFGFTGAAPIMVDTLNYFGQLGIQINEVYGMSECTGACTWSLDETHKAGSCGFAMPGVEVVIKNNVTGAEVGAAPSWTGVTEAQQGEICFRGRNVMMGYLANPDLGADHVAEIEKKTADAIDDDGILHSGDKGFRDREGMFKITGRYKELIIGAGGENVAPVPMEDFLKTNEIEVDGKKRKYGISDAMMVGDKRKFNVVLITLQAKGHTGEMLGTDELDGAAKLVNPEVTTIAQAMDDPVWQEHITNAIKAVNANQEACPSNASKIQKFKILPANFSVETEEFTPTLKLKRSVVEEKYADLIESMY
jgi:long-chain-fatty-acid--CoA ligase ACSBG